MKICQVEGCELQAVARDYCRRHYARWHKTGDPGPAGLKRLPDHAPCSVEGCDKPNFANGYCEMHRWRVREHGDPGPAAKLGTRRRKPTVPCSVEGCARPARSKGLCYLHYGRLVRTGEVGPAGTLMRAKGTGHITKDGYHRIHVADGRRVQEHVYVMEQRLGRRLVPPENVHHKNGIGHDNDRFCPVCVDIELPQELVAGMLQCASCGTRIKPNLELWLKMQPSGQRVTDLIEYIATYHADAMQALLDRRKDTLA